MNETPDKGHGRTAVRDSVADLVGRLPLVERGIWRVLRGGSAVFMFHRVLPNGERCYDSEMATSTDAFSAFLDWLSERYRVLPLSELLASRRDTASYGRPRCAITFDDGWLDNYLYAFPQLRQRGLPATIFLPLRYIGTHRRFWQEQLWLCLDGIDSAKQRDSIREAARSLPWFPIAAEALYTFQGLRRFLLTRPTEEAEDFVHRLVESIGAGSSPASRAFLNWNEVHEMQGMGISFGSHTMSHSLLTHMEQARARNEIRESREELADRLRENVSAFAYPWGAASWETRNSVKEAGYRLACSTLPGLVRKNSDDWMLPRISISNPVLHCGARTFAPGKTQLWCAKSALLASRRPSRNGKPIKIAFVLDKISDWEGGTERQLHTLIRTLDRTQFEPELCFLQPNPQLPKETLPCTAHTICSDGSKPISSVIGRLFLLTRLLRQMRPDIVQTFFIEGIFAGILAARLSGVPRIVGSARNAGYWKKTRHRLAFRSVSRLAHRWQCNSRTLWDYVRNNEKVAPRRIEILPNAIDLSLFTPATPQERRDTRRKLGLREAGPVFVTVAALAPVKDHATLLEAAKLLEPELPGAQYLFVGEGPLQDGLQKQAEQLGLARAVRFLGRQVDVRPYLAAADFGVLTSRSEGSSNSVLEYMAMGLPSALSDIPANRELVSGLFFAPGDVAGLAEALLRLARDPALCSTLRSEYAQTVSQFSLEKFARRAQAFYVGLATETN
jgi:glycosyltransferase involved in cell wall biosynthesis/peptidoglycan/xylan/chitin deacetylase (PgdA/CDA1 family)